MVMEFSGKDTIEEFMPADNSILVEIEMDEEQVQIVWVRVDAIFSEELFELGDCDSSVMFVCDAAEGSKGIEFLSLDEDLAGDFSLSFSLGVLLE